MVLPWVRHWALSFMCDFEEKWLMNAKSGPSFWNRYVDDTFTMFHNQDSANEFQGCCFAARGVLTKF